jgi:ABC-type uncharacterized transport system involved in gliding motility auxiliary subunit
MKTDPRRFAALGLWLSLLALLSLIGFLVVKGLAAAGVFTPPDPTLLNRGLGISAGVIVLGLAITALLDPDKARKFLVGRQVQYGSNSLIMLIAFLGILFFVNMLAYQNPKTWDLTEDKQNTLAPETLNTLKALPGKIEARAFYSSSVKSQDIVTLLDNFKANSNGNFEYQFIDPNQNPVAAQNDGIDRDGTVVMQLGTQKEQVNFPSEKDLASALVRLMNPEKRAVYFVTGHGEVDTENTADVSLTMVKAALQNKNYTVKTLNLSSEGQVPGDAKAVIIAGPKLPLSTDEVALLQAYMDKGGALIVMEDPRALTQFGAAPDPLADDLLAKWGISFNNDIVIDPGANPPLLVLADPQNYGQHPITEKLRGIDSRFFTTASIVIGSTPAEITLTSLAQTYPDAWGETDIKSIESNQAAFDASTDIAGPLTLAVAGENSANASRLVVFGDSEFASDTLYKRGLGDILINAIDWATEQENLINLTPKDAITRTFNPPTTLGLVATILTSICIIPLLIIAAGVSAWLSRRRRG